jgi:hypothetical protein
VTRGEELAALKAKLKAREGRPGFAANTAELKQRIAELEAEGSNDGD